MQRLFVTRYSADARFVITASSDMNVRVWKADASAPLKPMSAAERRAFNYRRKLQRRFAHTPEIRKLSRARVPKPIYVAMKHRQEMERAERRRTANFNAHHALDAQIEQEKKTELIIEDELE